MKVNEIFYSIQGEGLRSGQASIFIRLTGCNLNCDFCDTQYAKNEGTEMSPETIIGKFQEYPCQWVVITGGEPFHQNIETLLRELRYCGYKIQVETNGSIFPGFDTLKLIDHLTVSPKEGNVLVGYEAEIKYVIKNQEDIDMIEVAPCPIFLQPEGNKKETIALCVEAIKKNPDYRLSLQLHKLIGVR